MTTAAEVRGHLGRLWDPFTRGHLGRFGFAETAVVPVKPKRPRGPPQPQPAPAAGGGFSGAYPLAYEPVHEITEASLAALAERVAAFAESPELRTWTSAVLSRAGRRGADLSGDRELAQVLLQAVQELSLPVLSDPATKALYLASGLAALGLPTAVVAHGEVVLTRALAAVEASGRWWYADPHGALPLGHRAPFVKESIHRVQAVPAQDDELGQLRARVAAQAEEIAALERRLEVLESALAEVKLPLAREVATAPAPNNERLYKYVAVGAVALLAVTVYALVRSRAARPDGASARRPRQLGTGGGPPRSRSRTGSRAGTSRRRRSSSRRSGG